MYIYGKQINNAKNYYLMSYFIKQLSHFAFTYLFIFDTTVFITVTNRLMKKRP